MAVVERIFEMQLVDVGECAEAMNTPAVRLDHLPGTMERRWSTIIVPLSREDVASLGRHVYQTMRVTVRIEATTPTPPAPGVDDGGGRE